MPRFGPAFIAVAAVVAVSGPVAPASAGTTGPGDVHPSLRSHLVAFYDFDHPVPGDPALERDQGPSGTEIELLHGGAGMRVRDRAYPGGRRVLQTGPVAAGAADDGKAGTWSTGGVRTLRALNATTGITVLGWFKLSAAGPGAGADAIGLAGVLSGNSDGHSVRALLELVEVDGTLRLAALGRRVDGGAAQVFAAHEDWRTLLPAGRWVHLAATFDYDSGALALYRDGAPVDGFVTRTDNPWQNTTGVDRTSATDPRGIKIGGSFPWTGGADRNPCDCRMDALMFLSRSLTPRDVAHQYRHMTRRDR